MLMAPMNGAEGIDRRLRFLQLHLTLLGDSGLFNGEIAPTLQRKSMSGIEYRFNFFQTDAGVFDILTDTVGVALERFNGIFGSCRAECEIVLEEIIVPIDMGDGQD